MPAPIRLAALLSIMLLMFLMSGCASLTDGYANSWAGYKLRKEMCTSVRTFIRAPLGEDGARRAWFLPFGSVEGEYVDIYAPMASDPSDEYSSAFYRNRVAQLTHYHVMPRFASIVTGCLNSGNGFSRDHVDQSEDAFRASYKDERMSRRIDVLATRNTASFLVTSADWDGDVAAELNRLRDDPCEETD